ncbi:peptidase U32 family protein [Alteribacillus bidgolensis]|uniref:Putative protease n=1 Tax=Alteribacillus bidgolensis TaxID=930129 RepID=A0A1G8NA28_9BACI|nr:peptidase U32 family protein [Alteribacillus bidgolensis]SDI77094.1 putative protease [Alteribacillus bidgolensis]
MADRPELLVTPHQADDIPDLVSAGADAFLAGEEAFGLRLAGNFDRAEMEKAVELAHKRGTNVYAAVNAIFHNNQLKYLKEYIRFLNRIGVDAIVYGDPAVLLIAKETAPFIPLHWNTETTATNWQAANYWGKQGAERAVLARELNMDAITEIKENATVDIEIQVHGMACMFQSKRQLVGNYMEYQGRNLQIERRDKERNLHLYDSERDVKYPVFEDGNGTHIMSPRDMCIIDELDELLDVEVDAFKIEGIFKDKSYLTEVTALYKQAIDLYYQDQSLYSKKREIMLDKAKSLQPRTRDIDTGFFFKETVY